jgi:Bacteriophage capsid protein
LHACRSTLEDPQQQFDMLHTRGGVEIDQFGAAIGYHIRRAHQGDWWNAGESMAWDLIPRETAWGRPIVVHDFEPERAGQHRGGAGIFTSVVQRLKMLVKYDSTELDAAIVNAIFGAYIQSPYDPNMVESALGDDDDLGAYQDMRSDFHKERRIAVGDVRMPTLFPGESINTVSAARPSGNFAAFEAAVLRNVAAGTGLSAQQSVITGRTSTIPAPARHCLSHGKTLSRRRDEIQTRCRSQGRICAPILIPEAIFRPRKRPAFHHGVQWIGKMSGADQSKNFSTIATDGNGTWLAFEDVVGLFRSTDNGATWSFIKQVDWVPATTSPFYYTGCTAQSIVYSQGQWAIFGNFTFNLNNVSTAGQVAYSTDGGASFTTTMLPSGVPVSAANTAVSVPGALLNVNGGDAFIWRSSDNGRTWSKCYTSTNGTPVIKSIFADASGTAMAILYNGTSYFILSSADAGVTWSSIGSPITTPYGLIGNGSGRWLAIPQNFSNTAVFGLSTNNGGAWSTLSPTGGPSSATALLNADWSLSGTLIIVGGSAGSPLMYSSTDGGVSFSAVSVPFNTHINDVKQDNAGTWVAVGNAGQMAQSSTAYSGYSSATDIALPAIPSNSSLFEKFIQVS